MIKHAFLIICHKYPDQLSVLLSQIDDSRNDIFVLIDRKNKSLFNEKSLYKTTKSQLFIIPSINVNWAAYSMVKAEMNLLEAALTKGSYEYYHLLSGQDLLIKSQDYIHSFFYKNRGKQFISIDEIDGRNALARVKYYYLFQEKIGRKTSSKDKGFLLSVNHLFLIIQRKIGVNRIKKNNLKFGRGDQWFSITHEFASYIITRRKVIRKVFRNTFCPDESFIQTIILNSHFFSYNYGDSMRFIDWDRGRPYVFTDTDYKLLAKSNKLIARKFDIVYCPIIIQKIIKNTNS